ncbi:MAG: hypothetical protein RR539_09015 [Clostridium sp.]|uniref:hypothetical protein n=1 Tax=Clostridium sp. TaxID=1506 RepID=UPI002FC9492A
MLLSKGINYRGETLTLGILIFSVVMNLSGYFIDNIEALKYMEIINSVIPSIFTVLLIFSFYDTFMDNKFYIYMLPLSKKRIAGEILLKWFICYIIHLTVFVVSVFTKDDFTLLINNIDIKGELFMFMINNIGYPIFAVIIVSIMIIVKSRKIHPIFFVIGAYIVAKVSFYLPHRTYSFNYKIDMWRLWEERKIYLLSDTAEASAKRGDSGADFLPISSGESLIYYGGVELYLIALVGLFIWAALSIERLSMEQNIGKVKRRRFLYERKWYNK